MTARAKATKREITRAIKAAEACGLVVCGIEQTYEGFRILTAKHHHGPGLTGQPKARDPAEMARERREACARQPP